MKSLGVLVLKRLGIFQPIFDLYWTVRRSSWPSLLRRERLPEGRGAGDGPLPPRVLRTSVTGSPDLGWFLESGRAGAECIHDVLARAGTGLDRVDRILDFGCGCGRVLRHLPSSTQAALLGSDVNARAIRWCRKNLPFGCFAAHGVEPPLPFDADAFDLVVAFSVFTHLTRALQDAWALELARVLRQGGLLIVSLHGAEYRRDLTPLEAAAFDAGRLVVRGSEAPGSNRCAAYHPRSYVVGRLFADWQLVEHLPAGARGNPPQDLYLLRNGTG